VPGKPSTGVELRLFGQRPLLLAFGRPVVAVAGGHRAAATRSPAACSVASPLARSCLCRSAPVTGCACAWPSRASGHAAGRARLDWRALRPGATAFAPGDQPAV